MGEYLDTAVSAARKAGDLLLRNFGNPLNVIGAYDHDLKLELDERSQTLITSILLDAFPDHAILGEEGVAGDAESAFRWIIDPIDGTVNFFYGIPHFSVSIALQKNGKTVAAVILDPLRDEIWRAEEGGRPTLNGKEFTASTRKDLREAVVSIGFSKSKEGTEAALPYFQKMIHLVRKCRSMGSAALDMAYVACGRYDAYIEQSVGLWDIAAGQFLVEAAGGVVQMKMKPGTDNQCSVIASSGNLSLPEPGGADR